MPPPDTGELEKLFRYKVFKMLKAEGKINDVVKINRVDYAKKPVPMMQSRR